LRFLRTKEFRHEQFLGDACGPATIMPKRSMNVQHARANPEYPARALRQLQRIARGAGSGTCTACSMD
jgi:hypothetical protein